MHDLAWIRTPEKNGRWRYGFIEIFSNLPAKLKARNGKTKRKNRTNMAKMSEKSQNMGEKIEVIKQISSCFSHFHGFPPSQRSGERKISIRSLEMWGWMPPSMACHRWGNLG